MRTLDLTPMLRAMSERPGEFEMDGTWLRHQRSHHSFLVMRGMLARIEAPCSCSELRAEPSQADAFATVYEAWMRNYWRPLQVERAAERRAAEINRQFAAHFRPPGRVERLRLRLADACRAAWAALRRPDPEPLALALEDETGTDGTPAPVTRVRAETRTTIDA